MYAIMNRNDSGLFWSNDWGWGSFQGAEVYESMDDYDLPIEGIWAKIQITEVKI